MSYFLLIIGRIPSVVTFNKPKAIGLRSLTTAGLATEWFCLLSTKKKPSGLFFMHNLACNSEL